MNRYLLMIMICFLFTGLSTSFANHDGYWEMRVHNGENTQTFVVADIDSISFHSVQIPKRRVPPGQSYYRLGWDG